MNHENLQKPKRVIAFIDGYNLYHSIDNSGRNDLKWLNLWELCETLIRNDKNSELIKVFYFSAYAKWNLERTAIHKKYVKALEATGVQPILGNFKKKQKKCNKCLNVWTEHEEKETDVNIAIHLLQKANDDEYDEALLITADTDLTPAIKMVREKHKHKKIISVLPPNSRNANSLIETANSKISISLELLAKCQFVDELHLANGELIIIPEKYTIQSNKL